MCEGGRAEVEGGREGETGRVENGEEAKRYSKWHRILNLMNALSSIRELPITLTY